MKKILYITYDGLTDPLGQSQVIPYLVELSKKENRFVIISCEKKANYLANKTTINKILMKSDIVWYPISYTKYPPILSTIYDYLRIKYNALALHRKYKFDIVHCRSYIPSMVGIYLQQKYRVKFLFDMRGFWADERVDGGLWNRDSFIFNKIYLFFKKQENKFIAKSDHIVSLTNESKEEIEKWKYTGKNNLCISVIPCCVDIKLFDRNNISVREIDSKREELGLSNSNKIVSYLGSIGTWYMLDEMLSFFKVYLEKESKSKFLFITKDDPQFIKSRADRVGVDFDRIRVVSSDRLSVPIYLALSDFSIFFIKPAYSKKASSPTKQAELMSMSIPVVCNAGVGDSENVLNKCESGVVVNNFCEEDYSNAIEQLINMEFKDQVLRNNAIHYFSLSSGVEKYNKIYNSFMLLQDEE